MKGISGRRDYWSRRGYQRLRRKRAEAGVGAFRRRRFWRIRVGPKIRIPRIPWAKKMVVWVRDAYVRMMMGLASWGVRGMSGAAYGDALVGFGRAPVKEYDRKMIVHIYNSFMMPQRHLDSPAVPSPNVKGAVHHAIGALPPRLSSDHLTIFNGRYT